MLINGIKMVIDAVAGELIPNEDGRDLIGIKILPHNPL